jgi:hypothetical protein
MEIATAPRPLEGLREPTIARGPTGLQVVHPSRARAGRKARPILLRNGPQQSRRLMQPAGRRRRLERPAAWMAGAGPLGCVGEVRGAVVHAGRRPLGPGLATRALAQRHRDMPMSVGFHPSAPPRASVDIPCRREGHRPISCVFALPASHRPAAPRRRGDPPHQDLPRGVLIHPQHHFPRSARHPPRSARPTSFAARVLKRASMVAVFHERRRWGCTLAAAKIRATGVSCIESTTARSTRACCKRRPAHRARCQPSAAGSVQATRAIWTRASGGNKRAAARSARHHRSRRPHTARSGATHTSGPCGSSRAHAPYPRGVRRAPAPRGPGRDWPPVGSADRRRGWPATPADRPRAADRPAMCVPSAAFLLSPQRQDAPGEAKRQFVQKFLLQSTST